MNGGIDPEPTSSCVWCGQTYYLWDEGEDGYCDECIKKGKKRLDYSFRKENLTWFGRFFSRFIFKD